MGGPIPNLLALVSPLPPMMVGPVAALPKPKYIVTNVSSVPLSVCKHFTYIHADIFKYVHVTFYIRSALLGNESYPEKRYGVHACDHNRKIRMCNTYPPMIGKCPSVQQLVLLG